ncbi:MAG: hypothetical protein WA942_08835, partial [Mycolicibacter sinensis]
MGRQRFRHHRWLHLGGRRGRADTDRDRHRQGGAPGHQDAADRAAHQKCATHRWRRDVELVDRGGLGVVVVVVVVFGVLHRQQLGVVVGEGVRQLLFGLGAVQR